MRYHFIKKCEKCEKIIAQCACTGNTKTIEFVICYECNLDLNNLKHMLGMDYSKDCWGFRNYFLIYTNDGIVMESLQRLLKRGYILEGRVTSKMAIYHATKKGCKFIGLDEKQTKEALHLLKC